MKNILATLLGIIAAFACTMLFEILGTEVFPLAENAKPTDPAWLKANMDMIPLGAMAFVIMAHVIGIIIGMLVAGMISKISMRPAYIVAGLMLLATLYNLWDITHPLWFMLADVFALIIGFFFGKSLAQRYVFD